ncbi:predicted protein [Chaetomium globosum CBS 148.51]|uniref:Uncharacterized protein n=1 Tax=Chaetomium globosum (strain ATCC 6205 / CBS 148.51 / DSM 1962 / NBRC 6347 / NRRL 1970) TaxID=306901 RepID=Q2GYL2_CHAGB|nr:uncharacterized protein CHGG_06942 [Chaetomium globosum CBS 148.51]EAQ85689.1 predicted protein [Chaetomium globosum CBS 148.51]
MASDFPPAPPPMHRVRIAVYSDVPRLATVAIAGRSHVLGLHFEHLSRINYPRDMYRSRAHMFANFITNPQYIVLVVLGKYKQQEDKKVSTHPVPHDHGADDYELLKKLDTGTIVGAVGGQVIVGVMVWKLPPWSPRIGQFSSIPPPPNTPVYFDGDQDRDRYIDQKAPSLRWLRRAIQSLKKRYFDRHRTVELFAVHPAYSQSDCTAYMLQ